MSSDGSITFLANGAIRFHGFQVDTYRPRLPYIAFLDLVFIYRQAYILFSVHVSCASIYNALHIVLRQGQDLIISCDGARATYTTTSGGTLRSSQSVGRLRLLNADGHFLMAPLENIQQQWMKRQNERTRGFLFFYLFFLLLLSKDGTRHSFCFDFGQDVSRTVVTHHRDIRHTTWKANKMKE